MILKQYIIIWYLDLGVILALQAVSILLSCIVYGHNVSAGGSFGVVLVFGAVLLRVYCRQRLRRRRGPANI